VQTTRFQLAPAATRIHETAFVADGTHIVGAVEVGASASLWYGVVARGDVDRIVVGARSNVQDNSVLHCDAGIPCLIGEDVTIGHRCIIHGARIGKGSLVGMGSIVMNHAEIGEECLVAAGALIPEGKVYPPRSLILGAPARVKRPLTNEEVAGLQTSAEHYVACGQAHKAAGHDLRSS
jgi:carbonic anhydrase/acetyltransferase-like protein (isoleucine patch superfamily)